MKKNVLIFLLTLLIVGCNKNRHSQNTLYSLEYPHDWEKFYTNDDYTVAFRKTDESRYYGRGVYPPDLHFIIKTADLAEVPTTNISNNLHKELKYIYGFEKILIEEEENGYFQEYRTSEFTFYGEYLLSGNYHQCKAKAIFFVRQGKLIEFTTFSLTGEFDEALKETSIMLNSFVFKD